MNQSSQQQDHKDEVNLFDLFSIIKKALDKIGLAFLRFINFLIRNAIVLVILIIVGLILGYFLNKEKGATYQTEMIVATNFDGSQYLYKAIDELNFKLETKNKSLGKKLAFSKNIENIKSIEIKPIILLNELTDEESSFIRFFEDTKFLEEEDKINAFKHSANRHKITMVHKAPLNEKEAMNAIIEYLRQNAFFSQLYQEYHKDVNMLLESNIYMIKQLDSLVANYSKSMTMKSNKDNDLAYYNSENYIDLGVVLESRKIVQKDIKKLRQEKLASSEFLRVVDMGSVTPYKKVNIFDNLMLLYPFLLVVAYLLLLIFIRILKKAIALKKGNDH